MGNDNLSVREDTKSKVGAPIYVSMLRIIVSYFLSKKSGQLLEL